MTTPDLSLWLERLPHQPPMRLIASVHSLTEQAAVTGVQITEGSPFFIPGKGVPAWVALEYIGQTAALIGLYGACGGELSRTPKTDATGWDEASEGFLLASRSMTLKQSWFRAGQELRISAHAGADTMADSALALFNGSVTTPDQEVLVEATLTVWRGNPDGATAGTTTTP